MSRRKSSHRTKVIVGVTEPDLELGTDKHKAHQELQETQIPEAVLVPLSTHHQTTRDNQAYPLTPRAAGRHRHTQRVTNRARSKFPHARILFQALQVWVKLKFTWLKAPCISTPFTFLFHLKQKEKKSPEHHSRDLILARCNFPLLETTAGRLLVTSINNICLILTQYFIKIRQIMLAVQVLAYVSTLSYIPNAEFHSKQKGVKKNRIADFLHIRKIKPGRRFEHLHPIRDVGCQENKHLVKYHWATAAAFHKIPELQKSFEWKFLLLCKSSHAREKPVGSQTWLVPFLPGPAAKVTEQCRVSPYNLPSLSIVHIGFSPVKQCYF